MQEQINGNNNDDNNVVKTMIADVGANNTAKSMQQTLTAPIANQISLQAQLAGQHEETTALLKQILALLGQQHQDIKELKEGQLGYKVKKFGKEALETAKYIQDEASHAAKKILQSKHLGRLKDMIDATSKFFGKIAQWFKDKSKALKPDMAKAFNSIADHCQATCHMITKHGKEMSEILAAAITTPLSQLHSNIKKRKLNFAKRMYTGSGGTISDDAHANVKKDIDKKTEEKKNLRKTKSEEFSNTYNEKLQELKKKRATKKATKKEREASREQYLRKHKKDANYYKTYGDLDPISTRIKRVISTKIKAGKQHFQRLIAARHKKNISSKRNNIQK